jgi:DNA-binding response OmpR family regulator
VVAGKTRSEIVWGMTEAQGTPWRPGMVSGMGASESTMTHILIIEDDDLVREMLQRLLEREGYQVTTAIEGGEALRIFRHSSPALVITDLIMPGKEGIETILELRREQPEVKIIAISGGGRIGPDGYLKLAGSIGASRTFSKPLDRHVLLAAIRELLECSPPTAGPSR